MPRQRFAVDESEGSKLGGWGRGRGGAKRQKEVAEAGGYEVGGWSGKKVRDGAGGLEGGRQLKGTENYK